MRIVQLDGARTYLGFRAEALSGIILGCRIDGRVRASVESLLAERAAASFPAPDLFIAQEHPTNYALNIKRAPKLNFPMMGR